MSLRETVKGWIGSLLRPLNPARMPVLSWTAAYLSYFRSYLRRPSYVRKRWVGDRPITADSQKIAVFIHFDGRGRVHRYVEYYLAKLAEAGFHIVFVSNAPKFPMESVGAVKPHVSSILWRENVGYDFGAYKEGINEVPDLETRDLLVLCNDSVYGPVHSIADVVEKMDAQDVDIWGITDNWEVKYHIQSYFIAFKKSALVSTAFAKFWKNLRFVQSKFWVIKKYEIGLTQYFLSSGLRGTALCPYRVAAKNIVQTVRDHEVLEENEGGLMQLLGHGGDHQRSGRSSKLDMETRRFMRRVYWAIDRGMPLNSTHFFWDYMVVKMGCPFVKRDLLLKNPLRIPYMIAWDEVIRNNTAYDVDLALDHLKAVSNNRPV